MRIQQFSEKTGVSKRNIHFYIKENLLSPKVDVLNGYYDFSEDDYKQLMLVKHYRDMGLSVSNIKALLHTPASAEYYLRMHVGRLEQDIEILLQNKASILSLLEQLPINPDFNDLYSLAETQMTAKKKNIAPLYDGKLVNHFLWRTFWQKEVFAYADEMKTNVSEFIHNHAAVKQWKEHYHSFLVPQMHIFTGNIGLLAKEMSPFFSAYHNNSSKACEYVYEWMMLEEGQALYHEISTILKGFVNLEDYDHAELESMNTIFKY